MLLGIQMESIDLVQYTDFVSRIVAKSIPPDDVDDVSQDVMEDAIRALPSFRGASSYKTWIVTIAKRRICDFYRKRNRKLQFVPMVNFYGLYNPWGQVDDRIYVEQIIDKLVSKQAAALSDYLEGLSIPEVVERRHISYDAARSRLRRAITHASREVEHEDSSCCVSS